MFFLHKHSGLCVRQSQIAEKKERGEKCIDFMSIWAYMFPPSPPGDYLPCLREDERHTRFLLAKARHIQLRSLYWHNSFNSFKSFYPTLSSVETRLHMCYLNSCLCCRNKAEILILWDITQLHQGKNHTALSLKWRLFQCGTTKDFYSLRLSSSISGPFHFLAGVLSSVNIPTASPLQHIMAEKCGCDSSQATGASCLGQHRRLCSRHTLPASVQVCNIICGTTGSVISAGSGATLM